MGLASWARLQTSKEDDNGTERTTKVNGRMVHEKTSKGGQDEYSIIIGERFVVTATSRDMRRRSAESHRLCPRPLEARVDEGRGVAEEITAVSYFISWIQRPRGRPFSPRPDLSARSAI